MNIFIANLLLNLSVKDFWTLVNIWWSYAQDYSGLFFIDSRCIYRLVIYQYTDVPARFSEVSVHELLQYLLISQSHVGHSERQQALHTDCGHTLSRSGRSCTLVTNQSIIIIRLLTCVRPSTKSFSDFYLKWRVSKHRPDMRTSMTSTRPDLRSRSRSLSFWSSENYTYMSISSAILAWSSNRWLIMII